MLNVVPVITSRATIGLILHTIVIHTEEPIGSSSSSSSSSSGSTGSSSGSNSCSCSGGSS